MTEASLGIYKNLTSATSGVNPGEDTLQHRGALTGKTGGACEACGSYVAASMLFHFNLLLTLV